MFVLDTDHLTLLVHGHAQVAGHVLAQAPAQVAITLVTVEEQLSGWYTQVRKARDAARLARAYDGLFRIVQGMKPLRVLPFPLTAIQRFYALRKQLPRVGRNDLAIAAVVLEASAVLVTRNARDF